MRKTQTKDTIAKVGLCLVLLLLPESWWGFSLFWPVLFSLMARTRKTYWLGFLVGLILSLMTGTVLGLASLAITVFLFIFEKWRHFWRDSFWSTALLAAGSGWATDRLLGLAWSLPEGLAVVGLTGLVWRLGYFNGDVRLTRS